MCVKCVCDVACMRARQLHQHHFPPLHAANTTLMHTGATLRLKLPGPEVRGQGSRADVTPDLSPVSVPNRGGRSFPPPGPPLSLSHGEVCVFTAAMLLPSPRPTPPSVSLTVRCVCSQRQCSFPPPGPPLPPSLSR